MYVLYLMEKAAEEAAAAAVKTAADAAARQKAEEEEAAAKKAADEAAAEARMPRSWTRRSRRFGRCSDWGASHPEWASFLGQHGAIGCKAVGVGGIGRAGRRTRTPSRARVGGLVGKAVGVEYEYRPSG